MKCLILFLIIALALTKTHAQFVHKIKADSVLITNDSCTAELNLENSTKHIKGFLYNKGNGRTEFRKAIVLNDSTFVFGDDTLVIRGSGGSAWKLTGNGGTDTTTNFIGTTDSKGLVFKTNNIRRALISSVGNVVVSKEPEPFRGIWPPEVPLFSVKMRDTALINDDTNIKIVSGEVDRIIATSPNNPTYVVNKGAFFSHLGFRAGDSVVLYASGSDLMNAAISYLSFRNRSDHAGRTVISSPAGSGVSQDYVDANNAHIGNISFGHDAPGTGIRLRGWYASNTSYIISQSAGPGIDTIDNYIAYLSAGYMPSGKIGRYFFMHDGSSARISYKADSAWGLYLTYPNYRHYLEGNVGLGIRIPQAKLHVVGKSIFTDTLAVPVIGNPNVNLTIGAGGGGKSFLIKGGSDGFANESQLGGLGALNFYIKDTARRQGWIGVNTDANINYRSLLAAVGTDYTYTQYSKDGTGLNFDAITGQGGENTFTLWRNGNVTIGKANETVVQPYRLTHKFATFGTGIFLDTLTATTMGTADSSNRVATTAWVKRQGFDAGAGAINNLPRVLISDTATNVAQLDIILNGASLGGIYGRFEIQIEDCRPVTDNTDLLLQFSSDNGASFNSGASDYEWLSNWKISGAGTGSHGVNAQPSDSKISLVQNLGNNSAYSCNGSMFLYHPFNSSLQPMYDGNFISNSNSSGLIIRSDVGGRRKAGQATNAIRLYFSSGNIASIVYRVIGYRN